MDKAISVGQINFLASLGVSKEQMPATAAAASAKIKALLDQRYQVLHSPQQWSAMQALCGKDLYGISKRDASVAIQFLQLCKAWRDLPDGADASAVAEQFVTLAIATFVDEAKVAKMAARVAPVVEEIEITAPAPF